jgi:hypothetical protein
MTKHVIMIVRSELSLAIRTYVEFHVKIIIRISPFFNAVVDFRIAEWAFRHKITILLGNFSIKV